MTETNFSEAQTVNRPSSIRQTIPKSEHNNMIASAYSIIGHKNETNFNETERPKEKSRLTYEEKAPNNDIRLLTKPKQIRLVKLDLDSPRMKQAMKNIGLEKEDLDTKKT